MNQNNDNILCYETDMAHSHNINSEWLSFLGASYNAALPTKELETSLKDGSPTLNCDHKEYNIKVSVEGRGVCHGWVKQHGQCTS